MLQPVSQSFLSFITLGGSWPVSLNLYPRRLLPPCSQGTHSFSVAASAPLSLQTGGRWTLRERVTPQGCKGAVGLGGETTAITLLNWYISLLLSKQLLISTDKCTSYLSTERLLFATEDTMETKTQRTWLSWCTHTDGSLEIELYEQADESLCKKTSR